LNAKVFVDTNVFICSRDAREPQKQEQAIGLDGSSLEHPDAKSSDRSPVKNPRMADYYKLRIKITNLSPFGLMPNPATSFRRKPECSVFKSFWTPAFAGVTDVGIEFL
jgi:hypothetical protein